METQAFILARQAGIFHSLAVCLLFALSAYGLGCLVTRRNDCIAFAAGLLFSGILFLLIFTFSPLPWRCGYLFTVPFFAAAAAGAYFFLKNFRKHKLLLITALTGGFFLTGSALLPPYAWDEQVYQIELLSRYLHNNFWQILPDNPYSAWPGFLQSYLLFGFAAGGINFPRLFNTLLAVVSACTLFSLLRPCGKKTAWIITAAVGLSPLLLMLTRSLYAENTVALFTLAGFLSLYRLRKKPASAAFLAGLFAGGAAAVKLTSGGVVLALLFLCASDRRNRKVLYLFFIGALLASGLYFIRVWLGTGNPFYPFAASLFGTSQEVAAHHHLLGSYRYGLGPLAGTAFGWLTTAFWGKIYDGAVTGYQQLILLAALLFGIRFAASARVSAFLKRLLGALVIIYLFWSLTSQQCRFLLPALFLLAAAAGFSLKKIRGKTRHVFLALILLGTFFSSDLYAQGKHFFISWKLLHAARREPLRFLAFAQRDPDFIQILDAAGKTPPRSRILMLFEKRALYLPRAHRIADPRFQEKFFKTIPQTTAELMKELAGYDYLLLGSNEKNVDFQESDIALQKHLMTLIARALSEGKLSMTASGKQNSCHLLKIHALPDKDR